MPRFCTFLFWLMMLALPMQGFTAASMKYCSKSVDHMVLQESVGLQHHRHHAEISSASHTHAVQSGAAKAASSEQTSDAQIQLPDASHKCGVCASCCNLVGMITFSHTLAVNSIPNAVYIEPLVLKYSVPSRLPDKPPRA